MASFAALWPRRLSTCIEGARDLAKHLSASPSPRTLAQERRRSAPRQDRRDRHRPIFAASCGRIFFILCSKRNFFANATPTSEQKQVMRQPVSWEPRRGSSASEAHSAFTAPAGGRHQAAGSHGLACHTLRHAKGTRDDELVTVTERKLEEAQRQSPSTNQTKLSEHWMPDTYLQEAQRGSADNIQIAFNGHRDKRGGHRHDRKPTRLRRAQSMSRCSVRGSRFGTAGFLYQAAQMQLPALSGPK